MLSDCDDGFSISEGLWNEVKPLYDKLHSFVRKRMYAYYNYSEENFNETGTFPVFMSGKQKKQNYYLFFILLLD